MQRLCSKQATVMPRGTSASKPYLRGGFLRGYSLCSHATNLIRDCTVPVRAESTNLVSSSYHSDRGAELRKSDARRFSSCSTSLASLRSHTAYTGPRSYQVTKPLSNIYPTRNNSATKILATFQNGISSRWYSTGGPASPGRIGAPAEISKFWDKLRIFLETAIGKSRRELAIAANQTKHITSRVQRYNKKEPGSRHIHGPHVYTSIVTARTKLRKYIELISRTRGLTDLVRSEYENLAEFENELLSLDVGLEGCQERLRTREVEDTKKQDEEKRQSEDGLGPFAIPGSDPQEHGGWDHGGGSLDGGDGGGGAGGDGGC